MKDTALIILFFVAGIVLGSQGWLPQFLVGHDPALEALWLLMGLVGFALGRDRRLGELARNLSPRMLFLPLATVCGTFLGCVICAFFIQRNVFDCLAVGSGFAYYSLSSILITREMGAELGTVALLANIFREILTLIFGGFLTRFFGPAALVSCGGAASMDTILPAVMRHGGPQWIPAAILHGVILDFSVPFWVALFCYLAQAGH